MTIWNTLLAISIGIAIAAAMLAGKALRKCDMNERKTSTLVKKHADISEEVEYCKQHIGNLARCHDTVKTVHFFWGADSAYPPAYTHYDEKAETLAAGNVTLEELAKLVLDGTPIIRDVPTKTKYGVHKGDDDGKEE